MWRTSTTGIAVLLVAATVSAQQANDTQVRGRQRISMMEGVLERAVSIGADNLLRQMRAVSVDLPMFSGIPEVRGFRLDGYGIFFDVEVPALRLPVTWPLRYMTRIDRDLERDLDIVASDLRTLVGQVDARYRQQLEQALERLEVRAQGLLIAQTPSGSVATQLTPPTGATRGGPVDPLLLDDPSAGYTREVKAALIDAMLENSGSLGLAPEEWLTVAARDNLPRDPLSPGSTADFSTVIFKVSGSDLAAFRGGRLTLEEARKTVEVREY